MRTTDAPANVAPELISVVPVKTAAVPPDPTKAPELRPNSD